MKYTKEQLASIGFLTNELSTHNYIEPFEPITTKGVTFSCTEIMEIITAVMVNKFELGYEDTAIQNLVDVACCAAAEQASRLAVEHVLEIVGVTASSDAIESITSTAVFDSDETSDRVGMVNGKIALI